MLQWVDGEIKTIQLPDMPEARTSAAGALLGETIYVMGGQAIPAAGTMAGNVWKMELVQDKNIDAKWGSLSWQEVESWPGLPRTRAVAAARSTTAG